MRIFIVLFFSGMIFSSCTKTQIETPIAPPQERRSSALVETSYAEIISKTSSKIKDTKEFEECMQPTVNMCVVQVGNQLARSQKSPTFCDEMPDEEDQDACKFGVVMSQTTTIKDIKKCDSLTKNYRTECRISLLRAEAIDANDPKKCDAIASEEDASIGDRSGQFGRSEQCRSDVILRKPTLTTSDCNTLKGPNKDMCLAILKNRSESNEAPPPKSIIFPTNTPAIRPNL